MDWETFGMYVFSEEKMARYIRAELWERFHRGEINGEIADGVAEGMKTWALEQGATHYCHWFQPLTGATARKQESFLSGVERGKPILGLTGKQLIRGESDASSFPTGGLRGTAYAQGYTAWDRTSPAFIQESTAGKVLCIPTVFLSFDGSALDLKTPLLRAMETLDRQGRRLMALFGKEEGVIPLVGPEQEYFLVDRQLYARRRDLRHCGRTLFGAAAPKGQELDDQYFGTIGRRVGGFMQALNEALWKMGVMATAQHKEVAPGQYELAVRHCVANVAVDQNQLIMETMKQLAPEHGLVCLLHEKPFAGVNGSGKHNNWSICTENGENLLEAGDRPRFLLVLGCVLQAVDQYGDLLRLSAANPGNDLRLGGQEAPICVVSVYLGQDLQQLLEGGAGERGRTMDAGLAAVPAFCQDRADRNRTASMAFTGNKFEFRMVGSSDSVAMANTVICTAVAEAFRQAADALAGNADMDGAARSYAAELWQRHKRVVFNGDCYSVEWAQEAKTRGLPARSNMVDAIAALQTERAASLFAGHRVLNKRELESRAEVLYENYAKHIRIEARVMLQMAGKDYIPGVIRFINRLDKNMWVQKRLYDNVAALLERLECLRGEMERQTAAAEALPEAKAVAEAFRQRVVPVMEQLRQTVDRLEGLVDRQDWPVPAYEDLMFEV